MTGFAARATTPELMDADDLDPMTYAAVIADLARVNALIGSHRPTLAWLRRATRGMTHFSLVDVGFGHGDMLRAIARDAAKRGQTAQLVGIDLNPRSEAVARAATDPALGIEWRTGAAEALAGHPDFIISALTTHHMTDAELAGFLAWQEATATRGWFVNDLHRHPLAWAGFRFLAAVLRWHPIVAHDGALSVRRSFVRADWRRLLAAAGLGAAPVEIRWHLPFRWGVGRLK
ncbi:hypothetical protein IP88_07025 [alpha proteobacterium AAP81b]|nr:hypothetical protein IP88_07025 [alpha proteobacterium AAP81b]